MPAVVRPCTMQLPPWTANRTLLGLCATLAFAGCTKEPPKSSPTPAAPPATTALPPADRAPAPAASAPSPVPPGQPLSGTVVETMSSGGYTYAKLDQGGSQVWVAGPETPLAVGSKVAKLDGTLMPNFRSNTLNRTFDQIYFVGTFGEVAGATAAPGATAAAPGPGTPAVAKVERAAGGKTIAEIFAGKDALAGKPVVVSGKVVKVNNGIMGRNWIHLQDGTGAAGTNDLTITTSGTAAKGDVVVVRGNVVTNKDFGAGYSYAVLIEDATVAAK